MRVEYCLAWGHQRGIGAKKLLFRLTFGTVVDVAVELEVFVLDLDCADLYKQENHLPFVTHQHTLLHH